MSDAGEIASVRVDEVPTMAGPVMYEVHALWTLKGWAQPRTFFSADAAQSYARGLLDGLDVGRQRRTILHWTYQPGTEE